mgnify:FL=1|jgi:hypothetical protein
MGPYKELANADSLHSHRNKTKKLTRDRARGVQTQQARFAEAGETSEQRYARMKREEKAKKSKEWMKRAGSPLLDEDEAARTPP